MKQIMLAQSQNYSNQILLRFLNRNDEICKTISLFLLTFLLSQVLSAQRILFEKDIALAPEERNSFINCATNFL